MPKESKPRPARAPRKLTSTEERRLRAEQVRNCVTKMPYYYKRCKAKSLRCFIDTVTGRYARCIAAHAKCSLFVSKEEQEKVEAKKRAKRLELARFKESVARAEQELLELKSQEQEFARRDLAILRVQD